MSSKASTDTLSHTLNQNIKPSAVHHGRNYHQRIVPQSWASFQRMRRGDNAVHCKKDANLSVVKPERVTTNERQVTSNNHTTETIEVPRPPARQRAHSRKYSGNGTRWATSWADSRAQQALLTKNTLYQQPKSISQNDQNFLRRDRSETHPSSMKSRCVELDMKSAAAFRRLRSIYVNEVERDRRIQSIKSRMDDFQRQSIRIEVNKSIQEFNVRLKEDERNRRELRRVRDKFSETKKNRLKHMHVSKNALEVPSVSRTAYGLPQEGKEFSAPLSSKKTTDEIKNMWRMAFVRRNCIDTFLGKVASSKPHDLPDITIKRRDSSSTKTPSSNPSPSRMYLPRTNGEDKETTANHKINNLPKIETRISESITESLNSEDEEP